MLILFENYSNYEGCWKNFIAICSSEEVATQIAIKYFIENRGGLKEKIDEIKEELKNKHYSTRTPSLVSVLQEYRTREQELLTSTYLDQVNTALTDTESYFTIEEAKLISNVDEYEVR